jgi:hypothetical protein
MILRHRESSRSCWTAFSAVRVPLLLGCFCITGCGGQTAGDGSDASALDGPAVRDDGSPPGDAASDASTQDGPPYAMMARLPVTPPRATPA